MGSYAPGVGFRIHSLNKRRLILSFVGVGVAVCIMFTQVGFLIGVLESQALIAKRTQGDFVILDADRTNLHKWGRMEPVRLYQARAVAGVAKVIPVYQTTAGLRSPATQAVRRILVIAFPADSLPLAIGDPEDIGRRLRQPNTVLFDRKSRPIYPHLEPGDTAELNDIEFRVGGTYDLGADLIHDGTLVMSDITFREHFSETQPIMAVVTVVNGADRAAVRRALKDTLPRDVDIFTPSELRRREISFTLKVAPVGVLFGIGTLVGLVIGAIACYQVLFNEINDQISQYATLKAMGFSDRVIQAFILEQAWLIAIGGFSVGLVGAFFSYLHIAARTALPVTLTPSCTTAVFGLTLLMCTMAGLLAYRRVQRQDPADLF